MTPAERDIRAAVLRLILTWKKPVSDFALKQHLSNIFGAFTEADLTQHIRECETIGLICGTTDDVTGLMWDLTTKGKIKAQQL